MTISNLSTPVKCKGGILWINKDGKCHRINGPAWEGEDGSTSWFYDDVCVGRGPKGFWGLWEMLDHEQRNDLELHLWLIKITDT